MGAQRQEATKSTARGNQALSRYVVALVLLLSFSVVFWGLRDKLSLYVPAGTPSHAAKAKLLTSRERPAAAAPALVPTPTPSDLAIIAIGFFAAPLRLRLAHGVRVPQRRNFPSLKAHGFDNALWRRPPPVPARAISWPSFAQA